MSLFYLRKILYLINLWGKDKKEAVKKANELEILLRYMMQIGQL